MNKIYSPPPPTPPSISFTPRHLFFISPFTLAVLLGYWARVENKYSMLLLTHIQATPEIHQP